ncbi:MAG TPA: hypothetical protein VIG33_08760 [Pseudobdellovibrionaceae bacterium]|jgi:hypothetical protein
MKLSHNFLLFLQYAVFAMILFGIKLALIHFYGNATPYWDQWDAEAANLYKPFLEGTLTWKSLFTPHNEHHILITKLLALAELKLNGLWNPLLQMVVNAALHIVAILFIVDQLTRVIGRKFLTPLLIFSLVLFSIPYAWENTLAGIQSVFYFVLLFSTACLWLTTIYSPLSLRWWCGISFAVLAFFSLASGIFALAAAATIGLFLYFTGLQKTPQQLVAIVILSALFALGAALTPTLAYHAPLKAASPLQFLDALKTILAWPASSGFLAAFIRNLPALLFVRSMMKTRPSAKDRRWFLLALIVWMLGTAVSIAYGRAGGSTASRYLDLFAIFILINFACLIFLSYERIKKRHFWTMMGTALWTLAISIALFLPAMEKIPSELMDKRDTGSFQEINTRNHLLTGDAKDLRDKSFLHVPYPNSERLISILASPSVREILPHNIRTPFTPTSSDIKPADSLVTNGYDPKTPGRTHVLLGSYNNQGNDNTGKASITFAGNPTATVMAIPIAGFPLEKGMELALEQNGKQSPLAITKDPQESWSIAYAHIQEGPFTLHLMDSSPSAWVAIDAPSVAGRMDELVFILTENFYVFISSGIALAALIVLAQRFRFFGKS